MKRINRALLQKYNRLKDILSGMDSVLVAYSGGVDSTLLLKCAADVLNKKVLAVHAQAPIHPEDERRYAVHEAQKFGIDMKIVDFKGWTDPDFKSNTPQRCYICKKNLFQQLKEMAARLNIPYILDGENADDENDFRPGSRATRELGIRSPLMEAGLTKADIRELSQILGLDTWNKPSQACLASRFPYGRAIEEKELKKVEEAEKFIKELGITQVRVRHHGPLARIEVPPSEFLTILHENYRDKITAHLKSIGFTWIAMDLSGYRTGSLNESLS